MMKSYFATLLMVLAVALGVDAQIVTPALQAGSLTTELPGKPLLTAAVMYLIERSGWDLSTLLNELHIFLYTGPLRSLWHPSPPSWTDVTVSEGSLVSDW